LKDKVDDSNEAINAMNPNKFQAVATFASAAAGGISAVTGAMGLFGEQSEEVTKTLAKVQSAMALSQGLASLSELPKAWNNLKAAMASTALVQKIVTAGQWLWNAAMMANPIGLIIAGVAALTAGIYLLVKAFSSSNKEQEMQLQLTKDLNKASIDGAKNAAVERNNLDNLYKASTDQTKSLKERKDAQIELQKTYPLTFKNFTDEDFALGKANIKYKELSQSILAASMMKAKQGLLDKEAMAFAEGEQERLNKIAEVQKEILEFEKNKDSYHKLLKRGQLMDLKAENKIEEDLFKAKNATILGDLAKFEEASKLIKAEGVASKEKEVVAEKPKKAEITHPTQAELNAEASAKTNEDFRRSQLTAEQKQLEDFTALQKVYLDNKNITQEEYDNRLFMYKSEILDKINTKELEQTELSLIAEMEATNAAIDNAQFEADEKIRIEKERIEKENAIRKKEFTDKLELALKLNEGLQSLSDMAFTIKMHNTKKGTAEEEKALRAQFKINKALQLSSVIIQGILAAQTAYAAGVAAGLATTAGVSSLPLGAIYAGVSIAGTLAAIAKISATQFDTTSVGGLGGGGGGGGGDLNTGAATATSNSQPSTLLNPDGTVNNQNTPTPAPIQVYVVESDITSTQTQVAVVQNQMNFQ
jgi:hypothetical protein